MKKLQKGQQYGNNIIKGGIMKDFQVFSNKEKIGILQPDEWIVISSYEHKNRTLLRVGLNNKTELRVIGIIELELIEQGIKNNIIELKGIRKVKKKNAK